LTLHHGEAIDALEIERICGNQFTDKKFVSLCNSIIWASSKCSDSLLPSFTEREKVKDGGIDAEWDILINPDQAEIKILIKSGWNVYQYKRRDTFSQDKTKIFSDIKNDIKGAIKKLFDRTGKRPSHFLLFTNLDLLHNTKAKGGAGAQKGILKDAMLQGYDNPESVEINIIGAAELSSLLNDLPYIRSAFFSETIFSTWKRTWESHVSEKEIFGMDIPFIGREMDLQKIVQFIGDNKKKGLLLSGPHNIGKSRLILEATKTKYYETIFCLDSQAITQKDITSLETPNNEILVIIEDIEPSLAEDLLKKVLTLKNVKIIVSTPNTTKISLPNFGSDKRVECEYINPLDDENALKLFRSTGVKVHFGIESWIIRQAGGNPGILLIAGNQLKLDPDLFDKPNDFSEKIGDAFNKKIQRQFGDSIIIYFKILSLLEYAVINDDLQEIRQICEAFSFQVKPDELLENLKVLESTGFIRKQGSSTLELRPPLYANYLANIITKNHLTNIYRLLEKLDSAGQKRFLKRLIQIENPQIKQLWKDLLQNDGYFTNFANFQKDIDYILIIMEAVPEQIATILQNEILLKSVSEQTRFYKTMDHRFLTLIQNLIHYQKTAYLGFELLSKIAGLEIENISHDAEKKLCESFKPLDHQNTFPLESRLAFLKKILSKKSPQSLRKIGINIIHSGLQNQGPQILYPSKGSKPLQGMPSVTWGDIFNYLDEFAMKIEELSQDDDTEISELTYKIVPSSLSAYFDYLFYNRPENAIEKMAFFCEDAQLQSKNISIPKLYATLKRSMEKIDRELEKKEIQDTKRYYKLSNRLSKLLDRLKENKTYLLQIVLSKEEFVSQSSFETDLQKIALICVMNPAILSEYNITWLSSGESEHTFRFAYKVGEIDFNLNFLDRIINSAINGKDSRLFEGYFAGMSSWNLSFISELLDHLECGKHLSITICRTSARIPEDSHSLDRIKSYVKKGVIDHSQIIGFMELERWLQSENSNEFIKFVEEFGKKGKKSYPVLLRYFGANHIYLLENVDPRLTKLIYQCLLKNPSKQNPREDYYYDKLAAFCIRRNVELGYPLLEKRFLSNSIDEWRPIGNNTNFEFWNTLYEADKKRAILCALSCSIKKPHNYILQDLLKIIPATDYESILTELVTDQQKADLILDGMDPYSPINLALIQKIFNIFPPDKKRKDALIHRVIHPMSWSDKDYLPSLIQVINEIKNLLDSEKNTEDTIAFFKSMAEQIQEAIKQSESDGQPVFKRDFKFPEEENIPFKIWLSKKIPL